MVSSDLSSWELLILSTKGALTLGSSPSCWAALGAYRSLLSTAQTRLEFSDRNAYSETEEK